MDKEGSKGDSRPGLPSEHYTDLPRPQGFEVTPSIAHIEEAADVLSEVAREVSAPEGSTVLRLKFCHFRHNHLLSPVLFGFNVRDIDEDRQPIDPIREGREISYAVVLNLPVDLQREVALLFIAQLIHRQKKLAEMKGQATQLDKDMVQEDIEATRRIADRLRYGWRAGVGLIRDLLRDSNLGLEARYESDPFPDRDILMARIPALKRVYNDLQEVKDAIDRLVSAVGAKEPRIGTTGPTDLRNWLQQRHLLLQFRQYMNHTLRDANVLGNGYLVFRQTEPLGAYCVEPQNVWLLDGGQYRIQLPDQREKVLTEGVLHLRGIEQIRSSYGISMLEVFLYHLDQLEVFEGVAALASSIIGRLDVPSEAREWALEALDQSERVRLNMGERINSLLWLPRQYFPAASSDLFFPGHEEM